MRNASSYPLVSIVIPVYNGADYLRQAIDSALAQTWPNTEVVVVDDGSEDSGLTAEIAASYGDRIRYEYKPNGGTATAINRGIEAMRGEYFSWLSHDDVYPPDKIERLMTAVRDRAEPVVAFGDYAIINSNGEVTSEVLVGGGFDERQPLWAVLEGRIDGCALLVDKRCFERCGSMDPRLPRTHDYDLWFRIAHEFPFVHVPGIAAFHRVHPSQASKSPRFRDEVDLLWLFMLDRLSRKDVLSHASSEMAFLDRLLRAQVMGELPGARAHVRDRLRKATAPLRVTLAAYRPALISEAVEGITAAADAGFELAGSAHCSSQEEDWRSLALTGEGGSSLPLAIEPAASGESLVSRLRALALRVEGDLVWLKSGETSAGTADLIRAAERLAEQPEAVVCVLDYPDDEGPRGEAAALEGALIRAEALRTALRHCTGTLTSLVHALARLGPIVSVPAAHGKTLAEPPSTHSQPPENKREQSPLGLPQRVSAAVNRSPFLAKVFTKAVWRLSGGGREARARLLRWNGIGGLVDPDWYRRRYSDVANSPLDPVLHYLMFGYAEDRDPSGEFSAAGYKKDYPDVAQRNLHPLQHYALWGRRERRRIWPASAGSKGLVSAAMDGRPSVWIVLDDIGGSAARFARELGDQISRRIRPVFICGRGGGSVVLGLDARGCGGRAFSTHAAADRLCAEADSLDARRLLVLRRAGFDGLLHELLAKLARPFDAVHLDYGLVADQARFGSRGSAQVFDSRLDAESRWILDRASERFACSQDLANRLAQLGVPHPIKVAPPPDPLQVRGFRPWAQPVDRGEPLRIALFGRFTSETGRDILTAALDQVQQQALPLRFLVFGEADPALPPELASLVRIVQSTANRPLHRNVCRWRPHLAWFPLAEPGALGYNITEAQACGLPIAAAALGPAPERLAERSLSWLLPGESSAGDWIAFFLRLHRDGMPGGADPPKTGTNPPDDHRFFQRHLYSAVLGD